MVAVERTAGAVKVWTDSRFVCHGIPFLDAGVCPPFAHRDLWERAWRAWRPGGSSAVWAKAHLEWKAAQARGNPKHVWEGNRRADELAGLGAAAHARPRAWGGAGPLGYRRGRASSAVGG